MWPYHPDLLAKPVPRYTSYPTAADFGPLPAHAITRAIEGASGDISLYLHIPFCEKICYYCGCNTGASGRRTRVESYLAALHEEIAVVASLLPADTRVRRIAFGGGSPNAILPAEFLELVDALHHHLPLARPDWSIELDPRTMSAEWGRTLGEVGVSRASMGVQTFAPHLQKAIGREQDDALIARSVDWLRAAGVTSMNFDLMYGLPGQTRADLADSLDKTRRMGAERVAVFGYAHVPHMVPRQTMIDASDLPGAEERFAMAEQGYAFLTGHGYEAVGFDHFALPSDPMAVATREGTLRRNFQGFTCDPSEVLIGFGSSAISGFPGLIAQNEKNNGRYRMFSSQGKLSAGVGIARSPQDRMRARLIEELLCRGKVELSPCLFAEVQPRLAPFAERGLARIDGLELAITRDGLPYARVIASLFDAYRATTQHRFSSAI
ncbi:oxygen-independent coproporphyrinogen III oxidase [Erythrobacter sp. HL-111]|uniref:oxygen-independent coproporphyrinogen III oxidase n=1 Tax=Erythrobacter sp. HL-111 TaxID=1798193 RepID=UPI0006DB4D06|nr:oxygen-independent coproporphyrinogen III oxidase [Erythrobacter sp. HL-111]KPP93849.1 MAG: oxygen-independent coproporphyrinogen III oxidase HemN [Erythrobacteraceae bacterium HL-111]SDS37559.1 oxygen-independent coproporphyrinogen-3 oxidase [Erythrobacter sp. HL-111]